MTLQLPPLRERTDEIAPLAILFLERFAEKYHREVKNIDDEAVRLLQRCQWKGNIRELQNCIEKAVILSEGVRIQAKDLQINPADLKDATDFSANQESLENAEEKVIRAAMKKYNGNLSLVAKSLNISRPTLYNRLKKYGI